MYKVQTATKNMTDKTYNGRAKILIIFDNSDIQVCAISININTATTKFTHLKSLLAPPPHGLIHWRLVNH